MQFKRIHLPFKVDVINNNNLSLVCPKENDDTLIIDTVINELLDEGWNIVSSTPVISSKEISPLKIFTYTSGIEVFLINNLDEIEQEMENPIKINNVQPFVNDAIKKGRFQMPDSVLNTEQKISFYRYWRGFWDWDGIGENQILDASGLAIRTYLLSLGLISENVNSIRFVANTFDSRKIYLEHKIQLAFESIYENSLESKIKLFDAFNAIQLWGGVMGKQFYIQNTNTNLEIRTQQGKLIEDNWIENIDSIYRDIVKSILKNEYDIKGFRDSFDEIRGMGVAFATKHLNFWSTKSEKNILPIYDSFIYQILFAKEKGNPTWRYYSNFVDALTNLSKELNGEFTITDLERALFAYCKKIGVRPNNVVIPTHSNEVTLIVNSFINKRMLM